MDHDHDFTKLRNLLALKRLDLPQDTQVEEFLSEFHRRQRSQLFARQSVWSRGLARVKEFVSNLDPIPSLSYASVAAAIALTAFIGLSQQVVVTQVDGQTKFSLRLPVHEASFALIPTVSLSPKLTDSPNFAVNRSESAATRYVLANNASGAHDATVAF